MPHNSPVDQIAAMALQDWQELDDQAKREALERLVEARDHSKNMSEKIFLLLATLLFPIILHIFFSEPKFNFIGVEFALDTRSVFFFSLLVTCSIFTKSHTLRKLLQ